MIREELVENNLCIRLTWGPVLQRYCSLFLFILRVAYLFTWNFRVIFFFPSSVCDETITSVTAEKQAVVYPTLAGFQQTGGRHGSVYGRVTVIYVVCVVKCGKEVKGSHLLASHDSKVRTCFCKAAWQPSRQMVWKLLSVDWLSWSYEGAATS